MIRTHLGQHTDCFGCKIRSLQLRSTTAFQPHFNYSVGAHVDTERQFRDLLTRRADENSLATGTSHSYEMRDPAELATATPFPDHDDILNAQGKALRDAAS